MELVLVITRTYSLYLVLTSSETVLLGHSVLSPSLCCSCHYIISKSLEAFKPSTKPYTLVWLTLIHDFIQYHSVFNYNEPLYDNIIKHTDEAYLNVSSNQFGNHDTHITSQYDVYTFVWTRVYDYLQSLYGTYTWLGVSCW